MRLFFPDFWMFSPEDYSYSFFDDINSFDALYDSFLNDWNQFNIIRKCGNGERSIEDSNEYASKRDNEEEDETEEEYPPYDLVDSKDRKPDSIIDILDRNGNDFRKMFCTAKGDRKGTESTKKNPFVFIANRLTFLIGTKHPIIWDTSMIESGDNHIDIAIDEKKTFPKLRNVNDVGRITSELNNDEEFKTEINGYLEGTEWKNIFCFPIIMNQGKGNETLAIRFVVTK